MQNEAATVNSVSRLSPGPPLRSTPSRQPPARYTSKVDGSLSTHSMATSAKRGLKETIGLFESMSHQTDGEDKFDHIPKAYSSPIFLESNGRSSNERQHGEMTVRAWDVTPTPRLLSPLESGSLRSYSQSPDMDTLSSQASDAKPLLYTKPSALKTSRYTRGFVSVCPLSAVLIFFHGPIN